MNGTPVTRWLRAYDSRTSVLLWEHELTHEVSLVELQSTLGMDPANATYDCFPISETQAQMLVRGLNLPAVDAGMELFVEAESD